MVSHRAAQANNPNIPTTYTQSEAHSYIMYFDCNNLYGSAMMRKLPVSDLKWVENPSKIDILQLNENDDTGYFLEVDLEYDVSLHDAHNSYPLAPEHIRITQDMHSPYTKELLTYHKAKPSNIKKLTPNLSNKYKYIVHYTTLKLYISLGMKLTKIHRALSFKQTSWIHDYVIFNTRQRQIAKK